MGVTHIVACTGVNMPQYTDVFKYMKLDVQDNHMCDLLPFFPLTCDFIERALTESKSNKVLVHCAAGISRSGAVAIAYMMFKEDWDFQTAWKKGQEGRKKMYPNLSFQTQLKVWDKELKFQKAKSK